MVAILGVSEEKYCSIMQDFLAAKGENTDLLRKAYEFGRDAIAANLSIRDITAIHKHALSNILLNNADTSGLRQTTNIATKAIDFLTQSLLPIEESWQQRSQTKLACTGSSEESLQWVYNLASHLNEANTLAEIYHSVLQSIQQILKTERAAILIFDDRGVPRYQASMGISEVYKQAVENYCESLDEIPQTELLIFPDAVLQPGVELLDTMRKTEDINAAVSFPMQYQGRQLGKIAVYYDTPHQFTKEEIQLVQTLSMYASVAITRKSAEIDLKESQRFAQSIAESIPDILYVYDLFEQREVYTNRASGEIMGYTPEEVEAMGPNLFPILVHPDDMPSFFSHIGQLHGLATGNAIEQEYRMKHANGEWRWLYSRNTVFLKDAEGNTKQFLGIARDITDRKQAEEELRETQQFLQSILDNFPGAINVFDREDRHILVNHHVEKILSQTNAELCGKSLHAVLPPDFAARVSAENKQVFESGMPLELEGVVPQPDGLHTYFINKFPLFNEQGDAYAVCGISTDITERKRAELQLQESLEEKEVLLKEIHHRVKNNLQVVASLLNLQKRSIADPAIAQLFEDSKNRVYSMATIHESLYQSKQLNQVNLAKYLQDLVDALAQSNDIQSKQIQFRVDADAIDVNIETAMPCGLIVNELITNAIKHAFPDRRHGQISIECHGEPNGQILLVVRDNGVGMSKDVAPQKASSLGLRITNNLVRQLKGTIEIDTACGTCFSVKFAELGYQNRI